MKWYIFFILFFSYILGKAYKISLYFHCFLYPGERIAWNLQTTPAVFGSDIVLECILPNGTCCDRYTRRWLGGKNLNLLIMDGISSKPDKYSEEFTKESRLSKLIIHRLDSKDVNIPYQCTYGFSKDVKLLNMTDDNFESRCHIK